MCKVVVLVLALGLQDAPEIVMYDGNDFPDAAGWAREPFGTPTRTLNDGFLTQSFDQPGDRDVYRRSLADFAGAGSFFVEWRMRSDAPGSLLDASQTPSALSLYGNGAALYHTTITSSRVQFLRDTFVPLLFVNIDPSMFHTYRVELFGTQSYGFYVDGELIDSGTPLGPYPTSASGIVWGARYYAPGQTVEWDYIRYGTIPRDASGDYDSNDTIDLFDYYFARECFADPDYGSGPSCRFIDLDADGHADLLDFAEFQNAFGQSADYEK